MLPGSSFDGVSVKRIAETILNKEPACAADSSFWM
jgi:hypothetical protein